MCDRMINDMMKMFALARGFFHMPDQQTVGVRGTQPDGSVVLRSLNCPFCLSICAVFNSAFALWLVHLNSSDLGVVAAAKYLFLAFIFILAFLLFSRTYLCCYFFG